MFTGIIEDTGVIKGISGTQISVATKLGDIKTGDSISVNGVCLTVVERGKSPAVVFDVSPETFNRTNLRELKTGSAVNLERALISGGRIGGHFVTGHIDGAVKILKIIKSKNSEIWRFSVPEDLSRFIAEKGSVAIDGISLTVAEKKPDYFSAALIPHTLKNTTLNKKKPGQTVNLETDILAKYLVRKEKKTVTAETLKKAGYL